MRHGNRKPLCDKLLKERHDRARRAEDIAKADGAKGGACARQSRAGAFAQRSCASAWCLGVEGHDRLFGGELRLAHYRNGVHRLVSRNKDESLDAMRSRKLRKQLRRLGVVAPPFLWVHLDHRNMLVRRRVENDFRLLGGEKRLHLAAVVDVVHERNADRCSRAFGTGAWCLRAFGASAWLARKSLGGGGCLVFGDIGKRLHSTVDFVKSVFAALDHQNLLCARGRNLANDLRANRPACASHHHDLVGEELPRSRTVKVLYVALQELVFPNAARPIDAP